MSSKKKAKAVKKAKSSKKVAAPKAKHPKRRKAKKKSPTSKALTVAKKPLVKPVRGSALLNIKCLSPEKVVMLEKAKKHMNGNLSAWVRYASTHHIPKTKSVRVPA